MEKRKEKFKILFICTGNSCRSPMAEGILKKMLKESKLDNFEVFSAGTSSMNGVFASLFAVEVAEQRNVDLSQHRTRQLSKQILKEADLILAMSDTHWESIRRMDKNALEKVYLLKTFPHHYTTSSPEGDLYVTEIENKSQSISYIKDPIGGSIDDYHECFSEIEKEIKRIFPDLVKKAGEKN